MNNKLFVGNLPFGITEDDLYATFSPHGTVLDATVMVDRRTGRPRGFAFVTMSTDGEAASAAAGLNGADAEGRALVVNVARPREAS
jgi:RNA recognition motif-containing protein